MVRMAKTQPLKFIGIIVAFLALYCLSATNLFSLPATGQGTPGAVEYLHIDAPNTVKAGQPFELKLGLSDQTGKPVTDKAYGVDMGTFLIPTDGIKNAQGQVPKFNIDSAGVAEIKDAEGNSTGVYKIPVVVSEWPSPQFSDTYTVTARYVGGSAGTPDNSTNAAYQLTASTTFNAEVAPKPGMVKYAVPEIDRMTLLVPELRPNEPAPAPKMNTVTFRVKLIGQARSAYGDKTRALRGRALPDQLSKWQDVRVVDNTGKILNASLGEIHEEQVTDRYGRTKSLAIYDVPVNIESPAELAGRKGAVRFAFVENGIRMEMSATVNFATDAPDTLASANPFYASPYLVEIPHTPTIPTDMSGTLQLDFSDLPDDPENSTNRATDVNGNAITQVDLFVEIMDPDMKNITQARYYIDPYGADPIVGPFDISVPTPGWDVQLHKAVSTTALYSGGGLAGLADNRHTFLVEGMNIDNQWGPDPKGQTYLTIDTTPPTVSVARPVDNELVPSTIAYLVEGATTNPGGSGATLWSAVNRVEVFSGARTQEAWQAAEASASDFATWYFDSWDTTVITDGDYNLKVRVWDNAGNKSGTTATSSTDTGNILGTWTGSGPYTLSTDRTLAADVTLVGTVNAAVGSTFKSASMLRNEFTRVVRVDNTEPVSDIDAPMAGTGFKTSVGSVSLTGTASDANIEGWKIEYALGERGAGDMSGWASVAAGSASGSNYYQSSATNDAAVFKFNGTAVNWLATKGPDKGIAAVYVDGVFDSNVDLFNATTQYQQAVFAKSGLSAGAHTLKIVVTGTKNVASSGYNVSVDAFQVGASTYQENSTAVSYTPWTMINNGVASVTAASLGSWNISGFATGVYTLRLTTRDLAGNVNLDNDTNKPSRIYVYVDDSAPTSTVSIPLAGWVDSTVNGTATDLAGANGGNSGVDKVEVSVKATSGPNLNKYWKWTTKTWEATEQWNLTNILDYPGGTSLTWDDLVPATSWEWNTYNNLEGWTVGGQVTNLAAWGTSLQGESSGVDPFIYSPAGLTIDATNNKIIRLRMKTTDATTNAQVYFITSTDGTWNEAKSKMFSLGTAGEWREYAIDMSSQAGWTGTVTRLRIDPFSVASKMFYIDYLRVGRYGLAGIPTATQVLITSRATDEAGNVGTDAGNSVTVDSATPSTSRSPAPDGAGGWYVTRPTVTLAATDGDSGPANTYYIWTSQGQVTPPATGWTTYSTSAGQPAEGLSRLWYYSTDNVGNSEPAKYSDFNVDTVKPGSPAGTPPAMTAEPTYTKGLTNDVAWSAVTDTAPSSGTISYYAECDTDSLFGSPTPPKKDSGWISGVSNTFSGLTDGVRYYYRVKAKDPAGNESVSFSASTNSAQDNLAPLTTYALSGTMGDSSWYKSDVLVTLTPADQGSGEKSNIKWTKYKVSQNGGAYGTEQTGTTYTATSDGTYDIQYWSSDNVDNIEGTKQLPQFKMDKTLPTSSITSPAASTRLSGTKTVSGSAEDATANVAKTEIAIGKYVTDHWEYWTGSGTTWSTSPTWLATGGTATSWTYSWNTANGAFANGDYTVYSKATDNAGNVRSVSPWDGSRVFTVDNTSPQASLWSPTGGLVQTNTTVTVNFNEAMNAGTIYYGAGGTGTFKLYNNGASTWVPGTVTYTEGGGEWKATFTPTSPLTIATSYTATLTSTATDVAGNPFDQDPGTAGNQDKSWTFSTINIEAEIWLPAAGATVYGTVPIIGKASGAGFANYKVEYGQGASPISWTEIAPAHGPAVDSGLLSHTSNTDFGGGTLSNATVVGTDVAASVRLTPTTSFLYKKPITINNAAGGALTDHPVNVSVSYVSTHMNADFSDIRFTDEDGTSFLNYWIESYTASTSANVWVKVPSIAAGQTKTIYLFYGDPTAVSQSNSGGVFTYVDEFNGTSLDASWSKTGNVTVSGGWAIIDRAGADAWMEHSYTAQSSDYVVETKFRLDGVNRNRPKVLKTDGSSVGFDYGIFYQNATNVRDIYWNGAWNNANVLNTATDYQMQYYLKASPWTYYWRVFNYSGSQGSQVFEKSTTNGSGIGSYTKMRFEGTENDGSDWRFDWVRVRKYAPSLGSPSVGSEAGASLGSRYAGSGYTVSQVVDAGVGNTWNGSVAWSELLPTGTEITVQTRTGTDDTPPPIDDLDGDVEWSGWSTPTTVKEGDRITSPARRYIQYKVNLYGNASRLSTPTLQDITIYNKPLETWNTTSPTVLNGDYTIKLTVTNGSSESITATKFVHVDNTTTSPTSSITDTVTTRQTDGFSDKDNDMWVYNSYQTVPDTGDVVKNDATTVHDYSANFYRRYNTLTSGGSATVEFKVTDANSSAHFALEGDGAAYTRWAMIAGVKDGQSKLYVQYNDGTGWNYPQDLLGFVSLNTWYVATLKVNDTGNFEMEVYQKDSPSIRGTYSRAMPAGQSWKFHHWLMNGYSYLDNYKEEMHATANAYVKGTVGISGTASDGFPGVQKVELSIKNAGNQYWNGTGWTTGTPPPEAWLSTNSTSGQYATWSYSWDANSANFPDGTYTLNSRATDTAGAVETALSDSISVTVDNTAPTGSIVMPENGGTAYVSGGYVGLSGTISETNPWRYVAEYGSGASPTSWTQIGTVHSGAPGGTWSWIQTTDTDFNTGTKTNVQVSGTSSAASVILQSNPSAIVKINYWEFNGTVENWTVGYKVTPLSSDGASLNGQTTEPDPPNPPPPPYLPYVQSPATSIDATANKIIKLKVKVSDNSTSGKLTFLKGSTWYDGPTINYDNTTDFIEYTFDMTSNGNWSGTVNQLRFYPFTVQDKSFSIDYLRIGRPGYSSGTFTSAVYDTQSASTTFGTMSWTPSTPSGTTMTIQTRSGNTATPDSTWTAWANATSGLTVPSAAARYIQYQALMNTTDPAQTPTLSDITVNYNVSNVFEAWATASLAEGTYTAKVMLFDLAGNMTKVTKQAILDKTVPTSTLSAPGYQVGGIGYIRGVQALTGTASDNAYFDHFDLTYSGPASDNILHVAGPVTVGELTSAGSWNTAGLDNPGYTVKLYTVDKANNTATDTKTVTIDNTAPTVSSSSPPPPALITTDTKVIATFSEKVRPETVTTTSFTLTPLDDPPRADTVSYTESGTYFATLTPSRSLAATSTYTATVATTVTDLAGNALDQDAGTGGNQPKTWNFTVAGVEGSVTSPRPYARLKGSVDFVGTAKGPLFSHYHLTYAGSSSGEIATGGAKTNETLGTWNTTAVADGLYTITLTVTDTGLNDVTTQFVVMVDNTLPASTAPAFTEMSDTFGTKDTTKWTFNEGPPPYQTIVDDDPGAGVSYVIKNAGTGSNWNAEFYRTAYSITDGDVATIEFKVDNASSHLHAAVEHTEGAAYYRLGVRYDPGTGKLFAQYSDGVTTYEQEIISSVATDQWYVVKIKLSDTSGGSSEVKAYKKSDPYMGGTYTTTKVRFGEMWRFHNWVYTGNAYLDNYQETTNSGNYATGKVKLKGTQNDVLSGVEKAEFAIQKAGGQYWTGSGNNWGSENWLAASGTSRVEETSERVSYTGTWTQDGGAKYATGAGASASLTFTGNSITWISNRASGRGIASVYIDTVLDASINLDGAAQTGVSVYTKTWAESGTHTIKVEATGLPRVDVAGFDAGGDAGWSYMWDTASGAFPDGTYTFSIRGTDWAGNLQSPVQSMTLNIDNTNPQAIIASPAANGAGKATITITGKARDSDFVGYYLYRGSGSSPTSWTAIGSNPHGSQVGSDTENGTLDTWDVSGVGEGNYTLRLTVIDQAGRVNTVVSTPNPDPNKVYPIIVDKTAPYVEITAPLNEEFKLSPVHVTGTASDYTSGGAQSGVSIGNIWLTVIENVGTANPITRPKVPVVGTPAAWSSSPDIALPEGTHALRADATDNAGNVRLSNWVYVTVDATGPPTPILRAVADYPKPDGSGGVISLSWTPVRDTGSGVDYYIVKRGGTTLTAGLKYYDNTPMEEVDTSGKFYASNAKDATIDPNATYSYSYTVTAYDYLGNASGMSNSAPVKYDSEDPSKPMNLVANPANDANAIHLEWSQSTDNLGPPPDKKPAEYRVYRIAGTIGSPYTGDIKTNLIGIGLTAGQNSAAKFFDGDLTAGGTYRYQVVAFDQALNASVASDVAQATAGTPPAGGYGQPHVTFNASPDQCVMCHRTHTSQGKNLLQRYYEADLCFTCHDGTASVNPTKAEFDYSPNTGHRVKDDIWPSGKLSCIDCHNPHMNPISASFEDFEDDVPKPLGTTPQTYQYFEPNGWTVGDGGTAGTWRGEGDANATSLAQTNGAGTTYIYKDTNLDVKTLGGNFAAKVKFTSASGHAFLTVGSAGAAARSGVTADVKMSGVIQLRDGSTVQKEVTVSALELNRWYRIRLKIDSDRLVRIALLKIEDDSTETTLADFKDNVPGDFIKGATGDILEVGTESATAQFDNVKVNDVGMLMTRYRKYYRPGEDPNLYKISEDKLASEEFCLACHGTNSDVPGGSHRQYYSSIHNPLVGSTATPRWWDIRNSWKQIRQSDLGLDLKGTNNGCLYCHGYHGQQFYSITTGGEEELCYRCHGGRANFYSRSGLDVEAQYKKTDPDGNLANGPSRHGLTLREATIKCTSCHGQRAMTDRHIYEGTMSSIITNPFNIKQYWSLSRSAGMTMDDYCNSCHQESLPIETHTSTSVVPYSIRYPAMYTTSSANGFVRKGYSEKAGGQYIVGHKAYTTTRTIVIDQGLPTERTVTTCSGRPNDPSGAKCHGDEPYKSVLTAKYSGVDIWTVPELNTQMNCLSCHDAHATDYERLIRWDEDYKSGSTVTKGRCLHCHDGSVTQ